MPKHAVFGSFVLLFVLTENAHAYLDPGTGSVVMAAILGFFATALYTFRKYLYKLKALFSGKGANKSDVDGK